MEIEAIHTAKKGNSPALWDEDSVEITRRLGSTFLCLLPGQSFHPLSTLQSFLPYNSHPYHLHRTSGRNLCRETAHLTDGNWSYSHCQKRQFSRSMRWRHLIWVAPSFVCCLDRVFILCQPCRVFFLTTLIHTSVERPPTSPMEIEAIHTAKKGNSPALWDEDSVENYTVCNFYIGGSLAPLLYQKGLKACNTSPRYLYRRRTPRILIDCEIRPIRSPRAHNLIESTGWQRSWTTI
jgi:hypothetical protein